MGQRLVVGILKDNEPVMTIYKHWDAYSEIAIESTKEIFQILLENNLNSKTWDTEKAVSVISNAMNKNLNIDEGVGLNSCQKNLDAFAKSDLPFSIDRNIGVIDVIEDCMSESFYWADVITTIDLNLMSCNVISCFTKEGSAKHDLQRINLYYELDENGEDFLIETKVKNLPSLDESYLGFDISNIKDLNYFNVLLEVLKKINFFAVYKEQKVSIIM